MTLIRELIQIPDSVRRGDFVLRLTEGVVDAEKTLREYVVTPQLVTAFDRSLSLIKASIDARSSKGSYLHGSFGSGKSHFMAVMHLLLQGNMHARSMVELAPVIAKHNSWLVGQGGQGARRCLLVPFNMIGAKSMESAILGQYSEYVGKLHPDKPLPGVYLAEKVFENADQLRQSMGDATFFQALNAGSGGGGAGGWGDLSAGWDSGSYEKARKAPPKAAERARLVSDLVAKLLLAFRTVAQGSDSGESYVDLDTGLSILSKHAQSLGYDALILFLDEMILWLASRAGDQSFLSREGQKLAKLVESANPDRPVPIVSFIARQRDLRELVGTHVPGAEQLAFGDVLKWWEGRFDTITLEDRNLPAIAKKRVLAPINDAAKVQIDAAFATTRNIREDMRTVLLTSKYDDQVFRDVYPFSPALVETLVAISSVLQRERTALKVMLQLLVEQRDTLELGQLVPVGDLYDLIAQGDEAVTEGMKRHYDQANRLYQQKLLPLLEQKHGLLEKIQQLPFSDPKRAAFRNQDRIAKTLLLAALAPEVESLKALTPLKVAALNHGSIKSPIPGREAQEVLRLLREWAAVVGELKIGDDPQNPSVAMQLTGVDTETILEKARHEDNISNRRRKIREMLFRAMGIEDLDELFIKHEVLWKGTRRLCDVVFGNIRDKAELSNETFKSSGNQWKFVIDFPFDADTFTPRDDFARVQEIRDALPPQRTICWVPSFFTPNAMRNLGLLVQLDHLLTQDRLSSYTSHLSPQDRQTAKVLLENQQSQIRSLVKGDIDAAYGVVQNAVRDRIDGTLTVDEQFIALDEGFTPRPPVAADLKSGFERLFFQALEHQFPAHPEFETEIRPTHVKKSYAELQKAMQNEDGRVTVDQSLRNAVKQVVNPLRVANMTEQALVLDPHWKNHFTRRLGGYSGALTVATLRKWINEPNPMGLPEILENLIILVFAEQSGRIFKLHGMSVTPSIEDLRNEYELHEPVLPSQDEWKTACVRTASIFGVVASPLRNAGNVAQLGKQVREVSIPLKSAAQELVRRLQHRLGQFNVSPNDAPRLRTAQAVLSIVETIERTPAEGVVGCLASASIPTSADAMGKSLKSAHTVAGQIDRVSWGLFDGIRRIDDQRSQAARAILQTVAEALAADELTRELGPALEGAATQATALLTAMPPKPVTPPVPPSDPLPLPPVQPPPHQVREIIKQDRQMDVPAAQALELLQEIERSLSTDPNVRLDVAYTLSRLEDRP